MCGLAGIIFAPAAGSESILEQLGREQAHRGPDGEGRFIDGEAAIVHRRLAVIDLDRRSAQPFVRADLGAILAFNGEIYNFGDLRRELELDGVQFRTQSDTEVLLVLLARQGPSALRRLRGMFALAFWEPVRRQLVLARDPLGKKPLYFAHRADGAVVFASSVPSVVTALGRTPSVDPGVVAHYFAHLVVPEGRCIYSGIDAVAPGSWIRFEAGMEVARARYWDMPEPAMVRRTDLAEELEGLLRQAVRRRFIADVPVGAFLSAGKDSGLVVALAAEESHGPLHTFSAGTIGYEHDERAAARSVAERYGTLHTEVEVPPLTASALPQLLGQIGQPFGDASLLPSAAIAAAARRHVTVALTGDGGDELFFGYSVFNGVRLARRVRSAVPQGMLRAVRQLVGDGEGRGWRNRVDALLQYATAGFGNRMGWDVHRRARLLRIRETEPAESVYMLAESRQGARHAAEALRRVLMCTWLPADYLVKVDRATMASALEARCPFLDVDVVEFALRLPESVAFPGGRNKALLEPLVRRYLPESLHHRRKTGFGVPIREWLLGSLRPAFDELVLRPGRAIHEWIRPDGAREAFAALAAGGVRADRLWALLVFGLWGAMTLEGDHGAEELLHAA